MIKHEEKTTASSLHHDIRDRLRDDIVAGAKASGVRLTIDALAERYGSSHMPVREALKELAGEGLVLIEAHRGARARPIDLAFVENIFDIRIALESMLARRAAERISAAELAQLEVTQTALEDAAQRADGAAVLAANRQLHEIVNTAAANEDALTLVHRHRRLLAALWQRFGYGKERFPGVIADHRNLMAALDARDSGAAANIAAAHVARAKFELLSRMRAAGDAKANGR